MKLFKINLDNVREYRKSPHWGQVVLLASNRFRLRKLLEDLSHLYLLKLLQTRGRISFKPDTPPCSHANARTATASSCSGWTEAK